MIRALWPLLIAACTSPSAIDALFVDEPAGSSTEASVPAPTSLDPATIDAWFANAVEQQGLVGVSLVIVKDGKPVLEKGYGSIAQGGAAVTADTPFGIGSISKQLTCAVLYSLADEGKLAMTDPVAKYEPALPRAADVTLADLGGHTSGYRDYYPMDYLDRRMLAPIDAAKLVKDYAGLGNDFAPGTRYSYSNTGYVLLAAIAERVAGKPYGELLAERIAKPLGLSLSTTKPANAATGYVSYVLDPPVAAPPEATGWLLGAADVWASANDLAKWSVAFSEGKVLSPASRAAMSTPRPLADGRTSSYGCGLGSRILDGETVLSHTGAISGFLSRASFVPRTRSAVVMLTNDERADLGTEFDKLVRLVTFDPSAVPAIAGPPTSDVVRELIVQLQQGTLDRDAIGEDLSGYLDDVRAKAVQDKLRFLGTPKVTLLSRRERGAWEVSSHRVEFESPAGTTTYSATVFRAPDGKLRQFMLSP